MLAGRGQRRDASYLVLLGAFLLASDYALKIYADPKINPTLGRRVGWALLVLIGVLGIVAVLLGCYRLVRAPSSDEHEARS